MKTFWIQTLGCKVNHYESEQIAQLLRSRGMLPAEAGLADLRVVNTCSVTTAAASQSRQSVRRVVRLPMLGASTAVAEPDPSTHQQDAVHPLPDASASHATHRPRVIVTGCWATSDKAAAIAMQGVDAVLGHHDDVASQLDRFLAKWDKETTEPPTARGFSETFEGLPGPDTLDEKDDGWIKQAGAAVSQLTSNIKSPASLQVNQNLAHLPATSSQRPSSSSDRAPGMTTLPLLGQRQTARQRAFLKIQDGCDAHCTYCIIPSLRPRLWSKPLDQAVDEARALVEAGHVEIVLTGIFMGAYGQPTALRRRQAQSTGKTLGRLIDALCTKVAGLRRLRLSSLEPGDLTDELIAGLRSHPQVVPHFHLPLQSGSDLILRRMNRQYTRDDYLEMIERLRRAYDRPALTTDIVVGFPGEDDAEFEQTADLARRAAFIHVHAFPYSPRPGTAAARWSEQFIRGPVVNERIGILRDAADAQCLRFRESFAGQTVEVIVERDADDRRGPADNPLRHGRCERYFDVLFEDPTARPGDTRRIRVTRAMGGETFGEVVA